MLKPMDEFISLFLHGTKLAKELEQDIPNNATQLQDMVSKLDEMIRVFITAREKLGGQCHSLYHQMHRPRIDLSMQDKYCWRSTKSSKMELFQTRGTFPERNSSSSDGMDPLVSGRGSTLQVGGTPDVQTIASSSMQGPRRRKDIAEKRTMMVPAPRMGNTEIPPEDGFTWRKYGQKEILGSKYPRGYYRCTHQKFYQCPAKKQVQRLDDDPHTYEVTYRNDHTCHMSSTAPSNPPPPADVASPLKWLEFSLSAGESGASSSSGTVRHGKETEYPVADLADVMFNSASSSSNSMELIFTSMQKQWDQRDKKR